MRQPDLLVLRVPVRQLAAAVFRLQLRRVVDGVLAVQLVHFLCAPAFRLQRYRAPDRTADESESDGHGADGDAGLGAGGESGTAAWAGLRRGGGC